MLLSTLLLIPLVGSIFVLFLPSEERKLIERSALFFSGIALFYSIALLWTLDYQEGIIQLEEIYRWIPSINVRYHIGVDGISMPLVILTTLLTFVSILYSTIDIERRLKEYYFLFLLLEFGMLGVFLALDFFLFYLFWEISLVPMYFIIGVWGGPKKEYVAIKFFLYTLFGSLAMLLAILLLYFTSSPHTFDILQLTQQKPLSGKPLLEGLAFLGFFLAFAIKLPSFPFHTWLPDAHVEAPTAGSVILAGILLKMGGYGFYRILLPILPEACFRYAPWVGLLALMSIVYGALVAMAQSDFKRLVAYSSVNHMGYVLLAFTAASFTAGNWTKEASLALTGGVLEMVAHGLITGSLFLLVGMIYVRTHNRDLNKYGGLGAILPRYGGFLSFFCLASLGLPGLAGFAAEFTIFLGSFSSAKEFVAFALLGVIITAAFFLWTIRRVLQGPLNPDYEKVEDIGKIDILSLAPLALGTFLMGVYPFPLIEFIQKAIKVTLGIM
ncbi:NADH-quinone oxidoreductase subunit M [bacterium]|nr:NADH-quinone oxidoreductase subunit M [bacterium]